MNQKNKSFTKNLLQRVMSSPFHYTNNRTPPQNC